MDENMLYFQRYLKLDILARLDAVYSTKVKMCQNDAGVELEARWQNIFGVVQVHIIYVHVRPRLGWTLLGQSYQIKMFIHSQMYFGP